MDASQEARTSLSFSHWIASADKWFEEGDTYVFEAQQLGNAHVYSKSQATWAMASGYDLVFIDNTNVTWKKIKPYVELALANNYNIGIIDLFDAGLTDAELAARNTHRVPEVSIQKMRMRYQDEKHIWSMIDLLKTERNKDGG